MILLSEILSYISKKKYSIINQKEIKIRGYAPISSAKKNEFSFCTYLGKKGLEEIKKSNASVILCHSSLKNNIKTKKSTLIFVENPRIWFIRCIKKFFQLNNELKGIHTTANVRTKLIGKDVHIGAYCYIGSEVSIGNNTIIHSHVSISGKTCIGNNVTIKPFATIGYDGFGFEENEKGIWEEFPHIGSVVIEDNVRIGSHTCIDRAIMEETKIGNGTKIDNLVHIGHNAKIGKNCYIVAESVVGGSCIIEDNVFLSIGTRIRNQKTVGRNSLIGLGSVVTKDIPKNSVSFGLPAKVISSRKKYDRTGSPEKIKNNK
ncbi:LpxD N-terminal domain-containing protein [Nitrosopumilus ureiphilus]|uniref:UDP-3-O-(3-hydroxymyristoyl)glucosamine N-acyltransferase n=1 Tax=Nitrosopumilus ureiphilus TaxID=1470067 RepID=A0A7D5M2Y3_9ARCH|nr:LpxD N-terminal domain-containing protein [Nitrosopumilus ureiphilus]QLH05774.1 UDP-3-O-(3-hydroxymyristoyl)glucosamine N-acyltransferase [Nitrosopumilus ureiphilus]